MSAALATAVVQRHQSQSLFRAPSNCMSKVRCPGDQTCTYLLREKGQCRSHPLTTFSTTCPGTINIAYLLVTSSPAPKGLCSDVVTHPTAFLPSSRLIARSREAGFDASLIIHKKLAPFSP